jgi:hypothetical protein
MTAVDDNHVTAGRIVMATEGYLRRYCNRKSLKTAKGFLIRLARLVFTLHSSAPGLAFFELLLDGHQIQVIGRIALLFLV